MHDYKKMADELDELWSQDNNRTFMEALNEMGTKYNLDDEELDLLELAYEERFGATFFEPDESEKGLSEEQSDDLFTDEG